MEAFSRTKLGLFYGLDRLLVPIFVVLAAVGCGGGGGIAAGDCDRDSHCKGEVCIRDPEGVPEDMELLRLTCGQARSGAGEVGERCDQNSDCSRDICSFTGSCVRPCDSSSDCDFGERCTETWARTRADTMQSIRACIPRVSVVAGATAEQGVRESAVGGDSRIDTISISDLGSHGQVVFMPVDPSQSIFPAKLSTRDSPPKVLGDTLTSPMRNPFSQGLTSTAISILIPSAIPSTTSSNGYQLEVAAETPAKIEWVELSGIPTGNTLDLDLIYVGGGDWSPFGDRGNAQVSAILDATDAILSQAGIGIGNIEQHEVIGGLRDRYAVTDIVTADGGSERAELFGLSAGVVGASLPIFFVEEVRLIATDDGSFGTILGYTGNVPGPAGIHGTSASGVVIAVDSIQGQFPGDSTDELALTVAHEIGHFLGLYHTTELFSDLSENLADTPVCEPLAGQAPKQDTCIGQGSENLMFYDVGGTELSDDQSTIISRSFNVR